MRSKKTALHPDFMANFPILKPEESKDGPTDREQAYYAMSQTLGYKFLQADCEDLLDQMDVMNDNAVQTGMAYEELGRNTVVVSLVKGIIRKLMDKINDSKEACETGSGIPEGSGTPI